MYPRDPFKRHGHPLHYFLTVNHAPQITSFGSNPTNVKFFIYVPSGLVANPPIVVVIHWCSGSANAIYTGSPWKSYADTGKFLAIYPQAPDSGGCWDVHTAATLTHNAGGDSLGIVSAVRWTISNYKADASRVYATGISSGAMMTNVLLGAYPGTSSVVLKTAAAANIMSFDRRLCGGLCICWRTVLLLRR